MSFLQIASWNIEHLSGLGKREKVQSIYALAEHIEMAGVDIVALQEIYVTHVSKGDGDFRNKELDGVCKLLKEHLKEDWKYKIYPNRQLGDKQQLCAVLWDTGRVTKGDERRIPVSYKDGKYNLWDRSPYAIKFTMRMKVWVRTIDGKGSYQDADKSIVVIPIHMKSNVGGPTINRIVRAKEAATLCAQLPAIRAEMDQTVLIIGDTNILKYDEPAIETFLENNLVDLNNMDTGTFWSKDFGESPFDRAFVTSGRKEFKYARQYVLRSSDLELHDRYLSDHQIIKISVKMYVDDTDPRHNLAAARDSFGSLPRPA